MMRQGGGGIVIVAAIATLVLICGGQQCQARRSSSSGWGPSTSVAASRANKRDVTGWTTSIPNIQYDSRTSSAPAAGSWDVVPRGGAGEGGGVVDLVVDASRSLGKYIVGPKSDALLLLAVTAFIPSLCKSVLQVSPILGYLATGLAAGPNGFNLVQDVHGTEVLADLGIVFFLFEMGTHLDFDTLMSMRKDVFGLGLSQFIVTALFVARIGHSCGLPPPALVVLGGGLALSSSAFVLQLLKDKDEMKSQFGRSSFGVLLLQDLAVVPLLVVTPLLAGGGEGGGGVGKALASAFVKACMALSAIAVTGAFALDPVVDFVAKSGSQEAFLGLVLGTIICMSFLTEGLGLSNTLGAFLAGVLLSTNEHIRRIEKAVDPFRGILVGLFFFTVGFEIDLNLIASNVGLVAGIVLGLMALKAVIAGALCVAFGLPQSTAQRCGLILSQGGEFAFVAFRAARSFGILDDEMTKLMLTCVSLTMALTPFAEDLGSKFAIQMEEDAKKKKKN